MRGKEKHNVSLNKRGKKESMTQYVGCTPRHRTRGKQKGTDNAACGLHATSSKKREKRNGRHGTWIACRVVEQEGKKKERTTQHVGCTLRRRTRGEKKETDDKACGLHTVSSNERGKKRDRRCGMWVARRVVEREGKKRNWWHGMWVAHRVVEREGKKKG